MKIFAITMCASSLNSLKYIESIQVALMLHQQTDKKAFINNLILKCIATTTFHMFFEIKNFNI